MSDQWQMITEPIKTASGEVDCAPRWIPPTPQRCKSCGQTTIFIELRQAMCSVSGWQCGKCCHTVRAPEQDFTPAVMNMKL